MAFALLVLLAIQAYWIQSSIKMKETLFVRGVEESVTNVVQNLEKIEATRRLRGFRESARLYRKIDSLNFLMDKRYRELTGLGEGEPVVSLSVANRQRESEARWRTIRDLDSTATLPDESVSQQDEKPVDTMKVKKISKKKRGISVQPDDDPVYRRLQHARQHAVDELTRRALAFDLATQNVSEYGGRALERLLNPHLIDSLLNLELGMKGIRTPYEFGIYDPAADSLIFQLTGQYTSQLMTQGFAVQLYPKTLKERRLILTVYFPRERRFLLSQVLWMVLLSAFLVLAIVTLFYKTISTIIYQKKLAEMKNDFINNMTHEFKTPIATISLAADSLINPRIINDPEKIQYYIRVIKEENKRMNTQVESVLRMALIEKKDFGLNLQPFDVHDLINQAIQNISIQVEKRGGKITSRLEAQNPVARVDEIHFLNVMFNLLDNANKYSPETPEIEVSTRNGVRSLIISVKDHGMGMDRETRVRAFEKFYRKSTGNIHNVKGFGLGLAYVKAIITATGGDIRIESEPGEGSEFIIELPQKNDEHE